MYDGQQEGAKLLGPAYPGAPAPHGAAAVIYAPKAPGGSMHGQRVIGLAPGSALNMNWDDSRFYRGHDTHNVPIPSWMTEGMLEQIREIGRVHARTGKTAVGSGGHPIILAPVDDAAKPPPLNIQRPAVTAQDYIIDKTRRNQYVFDRNGRSIILSELVNEPIPGKPGMWIVPSDSEVVIPAGYYTRWGWRFVDYMDRYFEPPLQPTDHLSIHDANPVHEGKERRGRIPVYDKFGDPVRYTYPVESHEREKDPQRREFRLQPGEYSPMLPNFDLDAMLHNRYVRERAARGEIGSPEGGVWSGIGDAFSSWWNGA